MCSLADCQAPMKISDKINQASKDGQPWWSFEFFPPRTEDGWVNLYDRIERMQLLGPIFVDITYVCRSSDPLSPSHRGQRIVLSSLSSSTAKETKQGILTSLRRWGAGGATSEATTAFVKTAHSELGLETCMHLTCTNMPVAMVDAALKVRHPPSPPPRFFEESTGVEDGTDIAWDQEAHDSGCRNILALRGDPPRGSEDWVATEGGFNHAIDLIRHIRTLYGDYFDIGVSPSLLPRRS